MAEIPALKRRLIQQGVDVIDVGAGDADLAPPRAAVEALARAARDPAMSRYAFQLGLPAFREAAAAYLQRRFGVKCDPFTELHPLLGSKEGIAHLAMALLDVGDVAVVPEPGYAVYEGGTVLAGGESYRYALTPRTAFLLELEEVPAEVIGRTRLVYLNYPNNPTAAVATREYLERTVACRAGRAAGAAVLPQAEQLAREYVARFRERRDAMLPVLRAQGFEPETPRATLYLWVPLPEGLSSATFQRRALEEEGVVTVPGSGFGAGGEGFFRIALTVATPRLVEAAERLGKVLAAV